MEKRKAICKEIKINTITKKQADPLQVAANVYSLVMENDKIRVLDAKFKTGAQAAMHFHPDHVIYILNDGTLKITAPDRKSTNLNLKAGQAIWMQAGLPLRILVRRKLII